MHTLALLLLLGSGHRSASTPNLASTYTISTLCLQDDTGTNVVSSLRPTDRAVQQFRQLQCRPETAFTPLLLSGCNGYSHYFNMLPVAGLA